QPARSWRLEHPRPFGARRLWVHSRAVQGLRPVQTSLCLLQSIKDICSLFRVEIFSVRGLVGRDVQERIVGLLEDEVVVVKKLSEVLDGCVGGIRLKARKLLP